MENRTKIMQELDKYWSLYVRYRDNKCLLCGKYENQPEKLQAHHWILSRARSLQYRFDPRNGVSLCYGCHIHQVHTNPTVDLLNRLTESAVLHGVVSREDIEDISKHGRNISKLSINELRQMLENLKADYYSLPQVKAARAKPLLSRVNETLTNSE